MADAFVLPSRKNRKHPRKNIVHPIFSDEDADLRSEMWIGWKDYATTGRSDGNGGIITYRSHRIVMSRILGRELLKTEDVDHINRNRLDNRRCNLRVASRSQNMQNQGIRKDNTSGYRGVYWHRDAKKWRAYIRVNNKTIMGGYFNTASEAGQRAAEMRKEYGFFSNMEG